MAKKAAKPALGRVTASYLLRITLHERPDHAETSWGKEGEPAPEPRVADVVGVVDDALHNLLEYYTGAEIRIGAERTDK